MKEKNAFIINCITTVYIIWILNCPGNWTLIPSARRFYMKKELFLLILSVSFIETCIFFH